MSACFYLPVGSGFAVGMRQGSFWKTGSATGCIRGKDSNTLQLTTCICIASISERSGSGRENMEGGRGKKKRRGRG